MSNRKLLGAFICVIMVGMAFLPMLPLTYAAQPETPDVEFMLGPMTIDGKAQFPIEYGLEGSGTWNDPYVIENVDIETQGGRGILIKDSSDHIVIRNNVISSRSTTSSRDLIDNGTYSGQTIGIHVQSSTNTTVYNNQVFQNEIGIMIEGSSNTDVHNNTVYSNDHGIQVYRSGSNNSVHHNTIYNNAWTGIDINGSTFNYFHNNTIYSNDYGIQLYWSANNNMVNDNTIYNNNICEVYLKWATNSNEIFLNTIYGGVTGVSMEGSWNEIRDNTLYQLDYGIYGDNNAFSIISGNTLNNVTSGIYLSRARNSNYVSDNRIVDVTDTGITLHWESDINYISDNTVFNCGRAGIFLHWSSDLNQIRGNIIHHNPIGLHLNWSSNNNQIFNNTIRDNDEGILLTNNPTINTFYNNYFDNIDDVNLTSGTLNMWNISKTRWYNIIGGLYIAGNYWASYNGSDIDGDGLGDTNVPWDEGDGLPLVPIPPDTIDPIVSDKTTGTPTTGDQFKLDATATDNRSVVEVTLEHWFDASPHTIKEMKMVSGDPMDGDYTINVTAPSNALKLNYILKATDFDGNSISTVIKNLDVTDNDPPIYQDHTGWPITGEDFIFNFTVTENIGLSLARVEYSFDGGTKTTVDLTPQGGLYQATVPIPTQARVLNYMASFIDTTDNDVHQVDQRDVSDIIDPEIVDATGDPYTDRDFHFECTATDNWEVSTVILSYMFQWSNISVDMVANGNVYTYDLLIPDDERTLSYWIEATDSSGNTHMINRTVDIIDDVAPHLEYYPGTPETGDSFYISLSYWDNWDVEEVFVEYWFDGHTSTNETYSWGITIYVPNDARELHIIASVFDGSGNYNISRHDLDVYDDDYPTISDTTGDANAGQPFTVSAEIYDNVGINKSVLEVYADGTLIESSDFNGEKTIGLPLGAYQIEYIITVSDFTGNTQTASGYRYVIDSTDPVITDLTTGRPKRGQPFTFNVSVTDNVGVQRVYVYYQFDWWTRTLVLEQNGDHWTGELEIPENEMELEYSIYAEDFSGNTAETNEQTLYTKSGKPSTPDKFEFTTGILIALLLIMFIAIGLVGAYLYINWANKYQQPPATQPYQAPATTQPPQQAPPPETPPQQPPPEPSPQAPPPTETPPSQPPPTEPPPPAQPPPTKGQGEWVPGQELISGPKLTKPKAPK